MTSMRVCDGDTEAPADLADDGEGVPEAALATTVAFPSSAPRLSRSVGPVFSSS